MPNPCFGVVPVLKHMMATRFNIFLCFILKLKCLISKDDQAKYEQAKI